MGLVMTHPKVIVLFALLQQVLHINQPSSISLA